MSFKKINESFICQNCQLNVRKDENGSVRNHCPYCLYSLHLDLKYPGDRLSKCHGLMNPIGIDYRKNKGWMIIHECIKCGKKIPQKVSDDDRYLEFIEKNNKNHLTN